MSAESPVVDHYSKGTPIDRIRMALEASGIDLKELTAAHLSGVDEFHLGGRLATIELCRSVQTGPDSTILDVGCGIGGVSRTLAELTGAAVTGIDITPSFVAAARRLSELVGLDSRTQFVVADATQLTFPAESFDVATLVHVGMNIADKRSLFGELTRMLRPGGSLHIYDIMRVGDGELRFPLPWATDASCSFVASIDEYEASMRAAGLTVSDAVSRLELVRTALAGVRDNPPAVSLIHLMGADWPTMFGNLMSAMDAGALAPIEIVGRRQTAEIDPQ